MSETDHIHLWVRFQLATAKALLETIEVEMTKPANIAAADRDKAWYSAISGDTIADLLAHAARTSARSTALIGMGLAKMSKSAAKLNMMEYVRWKLYFSYRYDDASVLVSSKIVCIGRLRINVVTMVGTVPLKTRFWRRLF